MSSKIDGKTVLEREKAWRQRKAEPKPTKQVPAMCCCCEPPVEMSLRAGNRYHGRGWWKCLLCGAEKISDQ